MNERGVRSSAYGLGRRDFLKLIGLGGAASILAACQQAPSPAPTVVPTSTGPGPIKATSTGTAADWERQWAELVEAARKEGKVVLSGPPTPDVRANVSAVFKQRFGVEVEYLAGRRGDLITRLQSERAAGLYTVDVIVGGAQTIATGFYPQKMIDPIRPVLIHPEVVDNSKWKSGKVWFIDPDDAYALRLINTVSPVLAVNTSKINADEIKSFKDLLDPKYRGLIAQDDPTVSGSGSNTAAYLQLRLGEGFIRKLYVDQQVQFTQDRRQLSDWLGRGTYPIVINPNDADVLEPLLREGFPIRVIPGFPDLPPSVTAGSGVVVLMNKAPNPSAAKLLVNWLASREGMEVYTKAERGVPVRNDVDESWARPYQIPKPGVEYFDTYDWQFTVSDKSVVSQKIKEWRKG